MDNYLDELLTPKHFELAFQELFKINKDFLIPIKEIRLNGNHYNPFVFISSDIQLKGLNLLELQNKIITGTEINDVYTILNFK